MIVCMCVLHALACLSPVCTLEISLAFPCFKCLPLTEVKGNIQGDFVVCPDQGTRGPF